MNHDQAISLSNHIINILNKYEIINFIVISKSENVVKFSLDESIIESQNVSKSYQYFQIEVFNSDVWLCKNHHSVNLSNLARLDGVQSINKNTARVKDSLEEVFSIIDFWRVVIMKHLINN